MEILGIDIGGSGIKGAIVNVESGQLVADRHRISTPQPALPTAVAEVVQEIVKHFKWDGPIGCTFPAIVRHGVVYSAANVDDAWIGTDGVELIHRHTNCPITLLNDADAAGYAEMAFGAGRETNGLVIVITLGTGIGSALFIDGHLVPNTELGHLELDGYNAETRAADSARKRDKLKWKAWSQRVDRYLGHLEALFSPDLFIIGGGVSKKHHKFFPHLSIKTPIVPAELRNEAGIIGAAMAAKRKHGL